MKFKDLNIFNEMVDHAQLLEMHGLGTSNGLACPRCNNELYDSNDEVKTSFPPMRDVHCPECKWRGYRSCL